MSKVEKQDIRKILAKSDWELAEERFKNHPQLLRLLIIILIDQRKYDAAYTILMSSEFTNNFLHTIQGLLYDDIIYKERAIKKKRRDLHKYDYYGPQDTAKYSSYEINNFIRLKDYGVIPANVYFFDGRNKNQLKNAINHINQDGNVIGFDTKSFNSLRSNLKDSIELIQIALAESEKNLDKIDFIAIFDIQRLNQTHQKMMQKFIIDIFCNSKIRKIVHNFESDVVKLEASLDIQSISNKNVHDLTKKVMHDYGFKISLNDMCEIFLSKPICKYNQYSNWGNRPLRQSQEHYAALNSFILLPLHRKIENWQSQYHQNNVRTLKRTFGKNYNKVIPYSEEKAIKDYTEDNEFKQQHGAELKTTKKMVEKKINRFDSRGASDAIDHIQSSQGEDLISHNKNTVLKLIIEEIEECERRFLTNVSIRWVQHNRIDDERLYGLVTSFKSKANISSINLESLVQQSIMVRNLPNAEDKRGNRETFWEEKFVILEVTPEKHLKIVLCNENENGVYVDTSRLTKKFEIEFTWDGFTTDMMKKAQNALYLSLVEDKDTNIISLNILNILLKNDHYPLKSNFGFKLTDEGTSNVQLNPMDSSQKLAVVNSLEYDFTMIQGPPGTGKTVTSAWIVQQFYQNIKKHRYSDKILVAAPSNTASDNQAEIINKTGLKVLRICSMKRQLLKNPLVDHQSLHQQVFDKLGYYKFRGIKKKKYAKVLNEEQKLIKDADVICVTCVYSTCKILKNYRFPFVLIDEAATATEPECLIPMTKGAKQVVLVGDHKQLRPFSRRFDHPLSLFERKAMLGIKPIMLNLQYRMHPDLSEFSSEAFYDGKVKNGVQASQRQLRGNFPVPFSTHSTFFWHMDHNEEKLDNTFINEGQSAAIIDILQTQMRHAVSPNDIGIITPYIGQKIYLKDLLKKTLVNFNPVSLEIESVDSYQGREKKVILISTVRSNDSNEIGFINDERRMNVMQTRAKCLMIVVGNANCLKDYEYWKKFQIQYHQKKLIYQGTDLKVLRHKSDLFD